MKHLTFRRNGWPENTLEDPGESETLVELSIVLGESILTRNYNRRSGGSSDEINVPLLPLAKGLADNWWSILYEPYRSGVGDAFKARHRLDVPMHGIVFPAFALCSGGRETLLAAWAQESDPHSPIEFLTPTSAAPDVLDRAQVEIALMDLIETTVERLSTDSIAREQLVSSWDRVRDSFSNPDEVAYCRVAGSLGLDPYDPAVPDLNQFTADISPELFGDISDAAFIEELLEATDWVRDAQTQLEDAASVDLTTVGHGPADEINQPPWIVGALAAEDFRNKVGFDIGRPREELERVLGDILLARSAFRDDGPPSINVLVKRNDNIAYIGTVSRSAREQRFKACTGTYIAWTEVDGNERAATPAFTRRQQAARAFAAEILAPRAYLREIAPTHGFTSDQVEDIAGYLACPHVTVVWQALHAGIPLRGIPLPVQHQPAIV
jgi:hypothetical protein